MVLEEKTGETKWIFRYLRADRAEIDMGPYETREKAQKESDQMAKFGALCTQPIEVPKNYVLFQEEPEPRSWAPDYGL